MVDIYLAEQPHGTVTDTVTDIEVNKCFEKKCV